MRYAIVIESTDNNFSAFVPDLPGCVVTGESEKQVHLLIREAVELHIQALLEDGLPVPSPRTRVSYVETSAAA